MAATVTQRDPKTGRNTPTNLAGRQYGSLRALRPTGERYHGYVIWEMECVCGKVIRRPSCLLTSKLQKTCGCGPTGRPRIPNGGAHINIIYAHYRRSAADRKIVFDLTRDELRSLILSNCTYCGAAPAPRPTHKNLSGQFAWTGIDRADSAIGYIPSNCVPCCPTCNFAKGGMSAEEFFAWVDRVYHHLNPAL